MKKMLALSFMFVLSYNVYADVRPSQGERSCVGTDTGIYLCGNKDDDPENDPSVIVDDPAIVDQEIQDNNDYSEHPIGYVFLLEPPEQPEPPELSDPISW